jgi:hypothetical protein
MLDNYSDHMKIKQLVNKCYQFDDSAIRRFDNVLIRQFNN